MEQLSKIIQQVKDAKFRVDKAEFNNTPTEQFENELQERQEELINRLVDEFSQHYPRVLPPLQVNNPRPVINSSVDNEVTEVLELVGLEDEDDESLLIHLQGSNPEHHQLLNYLGVWYIYQFQADQATGYFQEILDYSSKDYVYFNLSYALAVQKILQPALEKLDLIEDGVDIPLLALNRAVIYDRLGRYEDAKEQYEQVVDDEDYQDIILFNWSLSAINFGKLDVARNLLKKLRQLHPDYPGVHAQLGQVAAKQGFYTEAVEAFIIAHREEPSNLDLLSDLATACLMAKRYHDAIDYYLEYLKSNTSLSVLNNLGAAYLQTKQFEKAKNTLSKALELKPDHKQSKKNYEIALSYLD